MCCRTTPHPPCPHAKMLTHTCPAPDARVQAVRAAAALRIAVWYKRCLQTRQARQTLTPHRQLLPSTSLDTRREAEAQATAATQAADTILAFPQDIERQQQSVAAVQTFHTKVSCTF